ncbi:cytidine deaminase [Acaryochloris marina]|uniref:Cytidine deaminase, putative n=1 Tax=Acaryochloris marina (strain MBIC 11017) TaxID=329726 RepID=B0C4L2_ACAM1|nr:cytidine deaminase [Acaryochloris marina]ABW29895.1 cytidine deaminase, putative [Acaryochloris marina MBIC11017]
MELDQALVDAAIELLEKHFPGEEGIAAAMYTEDREVLTSIFFEPEWGSGMLCAETGAICGAEKLGKRIIASVCVSRQTGTSPIVILTPCGICQERLFHWGQDVEVAVPTIDDATQWEVKTLKEVQPYYWGNAFKKI